MISIIIIWFAIKQYKRSESLLLNILPAQIAKILKAKEENISQDIKDASIIFIDLVDFTKLSRNNSAKEVLIILDEFFKLINNLTIEYKVEKIKTIGDGYMIGVGVPEPFKNSSITAVEFARVLLNKLENGTSKGNRFEVRIGIDTGDVSAGVIGDLKFTYDVWGDTVNLASRMESTGQIGKIDVQRMWLII